MFDASEPGPIDVPRERVHDAAIAGIGSYPVVIPQPFPPEQTSASSLGPVETPRRPPIPHRISVPETGQSSRSPAGSCLRVVPRVRRNDRPCAESGRRGSRRDCMRPADGGRPVELEFLRSRVPSIASDPRVTSRRYRAFPVVVSPAVLASCQPGTQTPLIDCPARRLGEIQHEHVGSRG